MSAGRQRSLASVLVSSVLVLLASACAGSEPSPPSRPEVQGERGRLQLTRRYHEGRNVEYPRHGMTWHVALIPSAGAPIYFDAGDPFAFPDTILFDVPAGPLQVEIHELPCIFFCGYLSRQSAHELRSRACRMRVDIPAGGVVPVTMFSRGLRGCRIEEQGADSCIDEGCAALQLIVPLGPNRKPGPLHLELRFEHWVRLRLPSEVVALDLRDWSDASIPLQIYTYTRDGTLMTWDTALVPGQRRQLYLGRGERVESANIDGDALPDLLDSCPEEPENDSLMADGCPR